MGSSETSIDIPACFVRHEFIRSYFRCADPGLLNIQSPAEPELLFGFRVCEEINDDPCAFIEPIIVTRDCRILPDQLALGLDDDAFEEYLLNDSPQMFLDQFRQLLIFKAGDRFLVSGAIDKDSLQTLLPTLEAAALSCAAPQRPAQARLCARRKSI